MLPDCQNERYVNLRFCVFLYTSGLTIVAFDQTIVDLAEWFEDLMGV